MTQPVPHLTEQTPNGRCGFKGFSGLVGVILILVLSGFKPYVEEGYRVYIGEDKDVDWIDVYGIWRKTKPLEVEPCFQDGTPIRAIIPDFYSGSEDRYIIIKDYSMWRLYAPMDTTMATLELVEPHAGVNCAYRNPFSNWWGLH